MLFKISRDLWKLVWAKSSEIQNGVIKIKGIKFTVKLDTICEISP